MFKVLGKDNVIDVRCADNYKDKLEIIIEGNNNTIIIDELVEISDVLRIHVVDNNSTICIGRGTTFEETMISVADNNNKVIIGEDCMFARNTRILASDFHAIIDLYTGQRKNLSKGVELDNHIWVGYGATILKNTHVMANSIIAAGTVVHGEIPPNSINVKVSGGRREEVTWERQRLDSYMRLPQECSFSFGNLRKVNQRNVIFSVETNLDKGFNKVSGWAFLEGQDSKKSVYYLLVQYDSYEKQCYRMDMCPSEDVAQAFDSQLYRTCRIQTYMPACIIEKQKQILRLDIVVINHTFWGRATLWER